MDNYPVLFLHPQEIKAIEKRFGTVKNWWINHVSNGNVWREFFGQTMETEREVVGEVVDGEDGQASEQKSD
jgi:hypothetical protein